MASTEAIFIGANRQTHVGDIHLGRKTIAFGAGNCIALWNPLDRTHHGVHATLKGHTKEVTCVRFFKDSEYMISGSEDASLRLWRFDHHSMSPVQSIDHHCDSIVCMGLHGNLACVGDVSGHISLVKLVDGEMRLLHEFKTPVGLLPLSLALQEISQNQYVLAIGGSKFQIHVYAFTLKGEAVDGFELVAALEGHEDWVKALTFKKQADGDYLLASGSQDRYIRLWRLRTNDLIDRSDEDETKLTLLSNKQYKFSVEDTKVAINFEALIMGHDDWISSLQWHETEMKLLASSADTAMMIWEPDTSSGIWICASRLGEISSKGASTATGSSGGFWASIWLDDDQGKQHIFTNGRTGSWRSWSCEDDDVNNWSQDVAITGATKHCTDLSWSPDGDYLLATSLDQTTRLFARWSQDSDGAKRDCITWREFARPQIHGYDMICVASLSKTRFISGGDEKILRSFDEPKGVANILRKFCGINFNNEVTAESASLPALGLSNKATSEDQEQNENVNERETAETTNISYRILDELRYPPLEDHLQRHTLWPEIEKLYGHGYEIVSVDSSPDNRLVASSCKSNSQQHSVIRLFDCDSWSELKPNLSLHNLTVTRVKFSPDGQRLLTVSRDRQFGIWKRDVSNNNFTLEFSNEKAHSRIIWDCSWSPCGHYFFTASRDKSIKAWFINDAAAAVELVDTVKFPSPVTSLDVYRHTLNTSNDSNNGTGILVVGLETGSLFIYTFGSQKLQLAYTVDSTETPADRVSRVRWSPSPETETQRLFFAAASHDNSVRVYSFQSSLVV